MPFCGIASFCDCVCFWKACDADKEKGEGNRVQVKKNDVTSEPLSFQCILTDGEKTTP